MRKALAALAVAAAASAFPFTDASAAPPSYAEQEGNWFIMGRRHGTIFFDCGMMQMQGEGTHFALLAQMQRVPFSMKVSIVLKTALPDGQGLKGSVAFKDGPTFSFTGHVQKGNAVLDVPVSRNKAVNAAVEAEKPAKVTLTRAGLPPETTDIDMSSANAALSDRLACMTQLMDDAGVLP